MGFFEFAGVDAEVAVSGFEDALEVVEAEGIVGGEGADDAEADALVNQAVELGEFGGSAALLAGVGVRWSLDFSRSFGGFCGLSAGLAGLADGLGSSQRSSHRVLAMKSPKMMWRAPKPAARNQFPQAAGARTARPPRSMKQRPITGMAGTEKEPPVMMPAP